MGAFTIYKVVKRVDNQDPALGWAVEYPDGQVVLSLENSPATKIFYQNYVEAALHNNLVKVWQYNKPDVKSNPKPTYSIGQRFLNHHQEEYILAQVDQSKCCFVSLSDGNRYTSPVRVEKVTEITESEFRSMWGNHGSFTRVPRK